MIDIKIVGGISSRDTFSINSILWNCGRRLFKRHLSINSIFLTCMIDKKIVEMCLLKRHSSYSSPHSLYPKKFSFLKF